MACRAGDNMVEYAQPTGAKPWAVLLVAGFCLLITQVDETPVLDPRIVALPLSTLMLLR